MPVTTSQCLPLKRKKKMSRRVRNILLAGGTLAIFAVAGMVSGCSHTARQPSVVAEVAPSPTHSAVKPPVLSPAQKAAARKAAAAKAAAQKAASAAAAKAAAKASAVKAAAARKAAAAKAAEQKAAAAKAAAARVYAHRVLATLSGTGIANSPPFVVTSSPVTATYTYDCSGFGDSGNFIADMETPDQSSLSSDDQSIANALGSGGTVTTTLYPANLGQQYYLAVNSECDWTVTVHAG